MTCLQQRVKISNSNKVVTEIIKEHKMKKIKWLTGYILLGVASLLLFRLWLATPLMYAWGKVKSYFIGCYEAICERNQDIQDCFDYRKGFGN